jgi:hypothetical protein
VQDKYNSHDWPQILPHRHHVGRCPH